VLDGLEIGLDPLVQVVIAGSLTLQVCKFSRCLTQQAHCSALTCVYPAGCSRCGVGRE